MSEAAMNFLITLMILVVVVAAVYGLVYLSRRRRDFDEIDPGIGTIRRLYFYGVSIVALMMAVNGVVQIGVFVLDAIFSGEPLSETRVRLAVGLSLTIVGLPLWGLHWRLIARQIRELPVEKRSVVRKAYVYVVLGVSAALAVSGAVGALTFAFGGVAFSGYPWAALLVWGGVWAFHWRSEEDEGQPTLETQAVRRLYLYLAAATLLSASALGAGGVLHALLREAYLSLTTQTVLAPDNTGLWTGPTREALAVLLVAAPVWVVHWAYFARGDRESILRQLYLYSFAIFGSTVTVIAAAGFIGYGALEWLIGVPLDDAAEQFRLLPGALTTLIIGGIILAYHWSAAIAESRAAVPEPQAARRAYPYALAALGLVLVVFAVGTLVDGAIEALEAGGQRVISGDELWRDRIALSATLGLLGLPLWGYYWTMIRRRVLVSGVEERVHPARRVFMFGVLGMGTMALLGSLSFLLFVFFREVLDGDVADVIGDARGAIAVIVPALVFLPYHWMVYREDRRLAPSRAMGQLEARRRKSVTVLINEEGAAFLEGLEAALGYRVSPLHRADPDAGHQGLSLEEFQALAQRIGDAEGANVLLVPEDGGVRVLSYR